MEYTWSYDKPWLNLDRSGQSSSRYSHRRNRFVRAPEICLQRKGPRLNRPFPHVELISLSCECNRHCLRRLGDTPLDTIRAIRRKFDKASYNEQSLMLYGLMDIKQFETRLSVKYNLMADGLRKLKVCKPAFRRAFGISAMRIQTILRKRVSIGLISDKRGNYRRIKFKLTQSLKENVKEHIMKYKVDNSHYCRNRTSRTFLASNHSLAKIHREFNDSQNRHSRRTISYSSFRLIVKEEFNLAFKAPPQDSCQFCDKIKAKQKQCNRIKYFELKHEHEQHLEMAGIHYANHRFDFEVVAKQSASSSEILPVWTET